MDAPDTCRHHAGCKGVRASAALLRPPAPSRRGGRGTPGAQASDPEDGSDPEMGFLKSERILTQDIPMHRAHNGHLGNVRHML